MNCGAKRFDRSRENLHQTICKYTGEGKPIIFGKTTTLMAFKNNILVLVNNVAELK